MADINHNLPIANQNLPVQVQNLPGPNDLIQDINQNMPNGNNNAQDEQDDGYWTRKRLVKRADGSWIRIGRLSRVFYKT